MRWIERVLCVWLIGCVVIFMIVSRHWPLTSDASLMHYVVFLMRHGMEPYRDIVDMNLPGSYIIEGTVMSVLGPGSVGWRLYDFALLALSSVSLLVILRPYGRLGGILAAALFILIHGRDGALMTGERDLAAAVFLQAAVAILFTLFRRSRDGRFADILSIFAGVSAGIALTIKPTLLLLATSLFFWTLWSYSGRKAALKRQAVFVTCGVLLPIGVIVFFLFQHHATNAFLGEMHGLIPYHASIHQRTIGHLLDHSIQPLLPMLLLWFVAAYLLRKQLVSPERVALFLCAVCGLLSYVLQRKAFWYQRYPFLAFLLPLFMIDFTQLLRVRAWKLQCVGVAGLATGVVLSTICLVHLTKYDRAEPPRQLLQDLAEIGTPQALSGHIQCIDTIGGCIDSLYHARIVQNTGFLYDCYMLDGANKVALDLRRHFWQQMESSPPRVIVMTNSDCYEDRPSFDRFSRWPEFQSYLDANYALMRESGTLPPVRYWSHPMEAYQYRVYVRR